MVHSGESYLKVKLALVETHYESFESLGLKLKYYHKEQVSFNKRVKALVYDSPEGSKVKRA